MSARATAAADYGAPPLARKRRLPMKLQKLRSIRAKLFSSFGLVLVLMLVVGILGITKVDAVGANADTVGQNSLPSMVAVKTIDGLSMDYRGVQFAYVTATTATEQAGLAHQLAHGVTTTAATFKSYIPLIADAQDRADMKRLQTDWATYVRQTKGLTQAGNPA